MAAGLGTNLFVTRKVREYGEDGISYIHASRLLKKYIARKGIGSERTGITYQSKLNRFAFFIFKTYNQPFDDYVEALKLQKPAVAYDLLADYAAYLKPIHKPNELRQKVKRAYKFLKFCGVEMDAEDFREQVTLPREEFPEFEGTDKDSIIELLNNCKNMRLKTALLIYAAMGPRKTQACAIRNSDVDLEKETITFRKEYAKMRAEYTRPMPRELADQIRIWNRWKYRVRPWVRVGEKREAMKPEPQPDELLLATWDHKHVPTPKGVADAVYDEFQELADRIKMRRKNGRRVITFHRLRAFAKSMISDLGYGDFSEWWIGHKHSTYYRKPEKERMELFRKIEPYLTFLDPKAMEKHRQDMQDQMDEMRREIDLLKKRDEAKKQLDKP
jgi:integrase